jgi:DNA-binding LacI/PurR family transcriptional regulator
VAGSIALEFRAGIEQAVLRLRELGHRKIGYVRGMFDETNKHRAYQAAMKAAGLKVGAGWVQPGYKSFSDGERAGRALFKRQVTAILAATDILALGVLHAACEEGVRVPEDLSVIGIDDLALSAHTSPALSSIGVPREHMARAAVDSLARAIQDRRDEQVKTTYSQTFHPQFVERRSLGPARH